ncbi:MAG: hypothetical protein V4819_19290 [Verrucomicrobiota bacterium]
MDAALADCPCQPGAIPVWIIHHEKSYYLENDPEAAAAAVDQGYHTERITMMQDDYDALPEFPGF